MLNIAVLESNIKYQSIVCTYSRSMYSRILHCRRVQFYFS